MNVLDILNSPWAIAPEKLNEICAIYAAHRSGEQADLKAIEAALGKPLGPGGPKPYDVQDGVAVVPLEGVLAKRMSLFSSISGGQSYQSFQQQLQQAVDDPEVKAIILSIDSPGGTVDGVQAAADALYAARDVKPVCAYVDGQMCSAAYLIGSAASQAYIGSDFDVVGSIGVVIQHIDTSAAEYMRGVKITDITAGKYKRISSQHAPLTPEGRGAIQDQLDHMYSMFVDAVARNRGVDVETVLSKMADGRVFTGQKAIDAGLVDGKMTFPQLMQKMQAQPGAAGAPNSTQKGAIKMAAETQETTYTAAQLKAAEDAALQVGIATGNEQGRAEGAKAERERIQAVEAALLPGHEKLIAELKFDGKTSGPEAAQKVVEAEKALQAEKLTQMRSEAAGAVPASAPDLNADAAAASEKKPEIDAKTLADKASALVSKAKAEGKTLTPEAAVAQVLAEQK